MEAISRPKTDRVARAIARSNAALWTETYMRNERGDPFTFRDHVYQIEPMTVFHRRVSLKKSRQVGGTLLFMFKLLWAMVVGKIPVGAVTVFPNKDKLGDFVETRWDPLLMHNAHFLGRHMRSTDNKHNKKIHDAMLMFRGGRLTQKIAGVAEDSASLRSDPQDGAVLDEYDLIATKAMEIVRDGSLHSTIKFEWKLSNPTVPGYGIDAEFEAGDQRYWMSPCPACNEWWAIEYEFPQIMRRRADGSAIVACLKCGGALDVNQGEWVARHPDRTKDHMSYQMGQLIRPQVGGTVTHLLDAYEHPPENDLAGVMRFKFGRAYIDAALGLSTEDVLRSCTREPAWTRADFGTAIGVDVGPHFLHVVIGRRLAADVYQVGAIMMVTGWGELKQVFQTFRCAVASIDNEPEVHAARQFQADMSRGCEVWLSDYIHTVRGYAYDQITKVVKVSRNEVLDETHHVLTAAGKLRLPTANTIVEEFARQCANVVKVVEAKPGTGDPIVSYLKRSSSVPDHFRHALANFLLAAHRQVSVDSIATTTSVQTRRTGDFDLFGS